MTRMRSLLRLDAFLSACVPVWGALCAVLAAAAFGRAQLDIPWKHMMGDPAVVAGWPVYLGFVSNVGGLLWAAAAGIFLFAFHMQRAFHAGVDASRFFLASGLFVALLGLDDVFMLHDVVLPRYLSIPQSLVIATYALLALAYLVHFAPVLARTAYPVFLAALALLAASAALDQLQDRFHVAFAGIEFWEDALKLLGIGTWLSYALHASATLLGREAPRRVPTVTRSSTSSLQHL